MAFLYITPSGKPWTRHSYSAGNTFDQCGYKYYLQKVLGWREKETKARFEFGKALESAIQWHHEHDGQGAVQKFIELWQVHAANKELQYTKVEKDWPTLLKTGCEMIKLYIIRQPSLPIPLGGSTIFQKEFSKEVFIGDPVYGGIEDMGKLDIIAYVDPSHPMLPKVNWKSEYGPLRPIIIDIKTAGTDFPEQYGLAAYDTQLRRYSWQTGIRDAALLWFTKKAHSLQKGYSVTLLEDSGNFKAGQEAVIAATDEDSLILVANDSLIEEMERVQGKKTDKNGKEKTDQTNEAKERRDNWLKDFGTTVSSDKVTKQRLQFNSGFITIESANDAGEIAGNQIIRIVNAWHRKSYPNTFGVRYPHDDTGDPYFRAFILKDEIFKQQNFTKTDSTELDDLFKEDDGGADE
jgi:PD-(D/E)XK nuclease superfamily